MTDNSDFDAAPAPATPTAQYGAYTASTDTRTGTAICLTGTVPRQLYPASAVAGKTAQHGREDVPPSDGVATPPRSAERRWCGDGYYTQSEFAEYFGGGAEAADAWADAAREDETAPGAPPAADAGGVALPGAEDAPVVDTAAAADDIRAPAGSAAAEAPPDAVASAARDIGALAGVARRTRHPSRDTG